MMHIDPVVTTGGKFQSRSDLLGRVRVPEAQVHLVNRGGLGVAKDRRHGAPLPRRESLDHAAHPLDFVRLPVPARDRDAIDLNRGLGRGGRLLVVSAPVLPGLGRHNLGLVPGSKDTAVLGSRK